MPDLGPLELGISLGLFMLVCVVPIAVSALFIFILLKVISAVRGPREVGERPASAPAQEKDPAAPPREGDPTV